MGPKSTHLEMKKLKPKEKDLATVINQMVNKARKRNFISYIKVQSAFCYISPLSEVGKKHGFNIQY